MRQRPPAVALCVHRGMNFIPPIYGSACLRASYFFVRLSARREVALTPSTLAMRSSTSRSTRRPFPVSRLLTVACRTPASFPSAAWLRPFRSRYFRKLISSGVTPQNSHQLPVAPYGMSYTIALYGMSYNPF